jgi:1-acyl-sn-glycerol-3-phosphate acyltransferase
MHLAGFQWNDGGTEVIDRCIASLRNGSNLIIFPEGTRTPEDARGARPTLQRGAAHVALRGGFDITPVRIALDTPALTKTRKWYQVPAKRWHVTLDVDTDLSTAALRDEANDGRSARRLNEILADRLFPATESAPALHSPRSLHVHVAA